MSHGGARGGAGRPKGAVTKRTAESVEAAKAGGITPLEYMLSIMRDAQAEPAARMDMAKAAAPYVHARLSAIDTKVTGDLAHTIKRIEREIVDPTHSNS